MPAKGAQPTRPSTKFPIPEPSILKIVQTPLSSQILPPVTRNNNTTAKPTTTPTQKKTKTPQHLLLRYFAQVTISGHISQRKPNQNPSPHQNRLPFVHLLTFSHKKRSALATNNTLSGCLLPGMRSRSAESEAVANPFRSRIQEIHRCPVVDKFSDALMV